MTRFGTHVPCVCVAAVSGFHRNAASESFLERGIQEVDAKIHIHIYNHPVPTRTLHYTTRYDGIFRLFVSE